jgi:hypothetical protein
LPAGFVESLARPGAKKIEVFFAIEGDVIVTVTVYVFYGKWEIGDGDSV